MSDQADSGLPPPTRPGPAAQPPASGEPPPTDDYAGGTTGPPGPTPWWRRWYTITAAAIVVLLVIAGIVGAATRTDETSSTTTSNGATTIPATTAASTTPTTVPTTTIPTTAAATTAAPTTAAPTTTTTAAPTTTTPTTPTTGVPTTAAPTTAPPTTVPTTAAPPQPVTYEGTGDSVLAVSLPNPNSTATITHTGGSNFVVKAEDADLAHPELLVNTIGDYQGTVLLPAGTANLEISADGRWTVALLPVSAVKSFDSGHMAGHGDDVVLYTGPTKPAAITHNGASNFVVRSIPMSGGSPDLLVNEIGPYSGTVRFPGSSVVEINADGEWSITIS